MTEERMNELEEMMTETEDLINHWLKPVELIAFSKRDLFAGLAMMGLLASDTVQVWLEEKSQETGEGCASDIAFTAAVVADALIAELAKGKT